MRSRAGPGRFLRSGGASRLRAQAWEQTGHQHLGAAGTRGRAGTWALPFLFFTGCRGQTWTLASSTHRGLGKVTVSEPQFLYKSGFISSAYFTGRWKD